MNADSMQGIECGQNMNAQLNRVTLGSDGESMARMSRGRQSSRTRRTCVSPHTATKPTKRVIFELSSHKESNVDNILASHPLHSAL